MNMRTITLWICKIFGLFWLSSKLTSKYLRILGYHAFSLKDEHKFRPNMFMQYDTFLLRMKYLQKNKYNVVCLDDAMKMIQRGDIRKNTVVITIDDGFYSVFKIAMPVLQKFNFPATLYLTTHYFNHGKPVFSLVIQYMFWKSKIKNQEILDKLRMVYQDLNNDLKNEEDIISKLIEYGTEFLDEEEKDRFLVKLGEILDINYDTIYDSRILSLINDEELSILKQNKINIQLHTHTHAMPDDKNALNKEIKKNRAKIDDHVDYKLIHFCYPSGQWSEDNFEILTECGILSGVTCDPGLNTVSQNLLSLRRFLDADNDKQIEFEAALSGFKYLVKKVIKSIKKLLTWLIHKLRNNTDKGLKLFKLQIILAQYYDIFYLFE